MTWWLLLIVSSYGLILLQQSTNVFLITDFPAYNLFCTSKKQLADGLKASRHTSLSLLTYLVRKYRRNQNQVTTFHPMKEGNSRNTSQWHARWSPTHPGLLQPIRRGSSEICQGHCFGIFHLVGRQEACCKPGLRAVSGRSFMIALFSLTYSF